MPTITELKMITCPACGATNRVVLERIERGAGARCGRCHAPLPSNVLPLEVTDGTFARDVEQSPLPVLLDLWAAWCGPCRMQGPIIDQLAAELAGRVRVCKVDVDSNPRTAMRFDVRSIPTLLLLERGREVDRMVGAQSKAEILRRLSVYGTI